MQELCCEAQHRNFLIHVTKNGLALGTMGALPPQAHKGMFILKGRQMGKRISDCVLALWMMGAGAVAVSEERRGQNKTPSILTH